MNPKCYSYIRFSTLEQQKGDSLRRQLKLSEDYAKEHGLKLDPMSDMGLSAFKGEHRSKGALGQFLALVEAGKIPKGSTLVVESLDRLSREQVLDALEQFLAIIRAGIKVVTLADRMEYTRESINLNIGQLMFSLTIMSRAHEESLTKARRLKAAWAGKRDKINQRKITARAPEWLKLNKAHTSFEAIPERAEIIRRIFIEKNAGVGTRIIAQKLNNQTAWLPNRQKSNGTPPGWRESYIQKILRSRAVIGEYQLHEIVTKEGKRIRQPVGDPIKNYFPAVVPEELFYAVQERLAENKEKAGNGGGQTGKISNLFGHIAKCGYCNAPMAFISKGPKPKGGSYLICDNARRGLKCKRRNIRYDEFEELVLTFCKGLNPTEILPGNEERESTLNILKGQVVTLHGKKKEAARQTENLTDTIAMTDNKNVRLTLEKKLAEALEQLSSYEMEEKQLSKEIERLSHAQDDTGKRLNSLRELFTYLKTQTGNDLIDLRLRLREELRGLIERIDVYPVGRVPMTEDHANKMIKAVLDVCPDTNKKELKEELIARIENKDLRQFNIQFKSGSMRIIVPATRHKLSLDINLEEKRVRHLLEGLDGETIEVAL